MREKILRLLFWLLFPHRLREAVQYGVEKTRRDPSFSNLGFSSLGREVRRDEACEWAKHAARASGAAFTNPDICLACELYYQAYCLHLR